MQVSQVNDHITHAIIGGGETIEFGISSSAEFFNILSSTLYKDQILAVVRETLCNAWDAHIEAGKQHMPVEITLTDDKFIIRDHGKGIHKDDMGLIYGTYGNSTKKNDGTQTGGFGLGCKSPFAYTDHFEVQSSHDGVKTIYNLSKSNAQAMGKPGIIPIASFPTTETGLQVSIGIHNPKDRHRFHRLIHRIVKNGDMNMIFNGEPMDKLNFDTSKSNYMIVRGINIIDENYKIMIRYGNVIYPVDITDGIVEAYRKVETHLNKLGGGNRYCSYQIVFQAPPHSIAVTPSRESLSMQDHTVKTLNILFNDFMAMVNGRFQTKCHDYAKEAVDIAVKEAKVDKLLSTAEELPIKLYTDSDAAISICDLETMAKQYMVSNYPRGFKFRKLDISYRLKQMAAAGLLDRGLVQTYLRALNEVGDASYYSNGDWLRKRLLAPILSKMQSQGIEHERFYVLDCNDNKAFSSYDRDLPPLVEATRTSPRSLFNCLPYLRNIVVIASSRKEILKRAYKHDVFKKLGNYTGFLFYHASMKKAEKEAVIAFFTGLKMEVVDLTFRQPWEVNPITKQASVRKPVKKGIPCLTSLLGKARQNFNLAYSAYDDADRIENPEFIAKVSLATKDNSLSWFPNWNSETSKYIVSLFGTKGAVTNNQAVYDKYIANGVKDIDTYVTEKLYAYIISSPTIRDYWRFDVDRVGKQYDVSDDSLLKIIYGNETLRKKFGILKPKLTDEDRKYLELWEYWDNRYYNRHNRSKEQIVVADYLKSIPLDFANQLLARRLHNSKLTRLINPYNLKSLVTSPETADKTIQILLAILN